MRGELRRGSGGGEKSPSGVMVKAARTLIRAVKLAPIAPHRAARGPCKRSHS